MADDEEFLKMRERVLALHGHAVDTPAATPEADPATPATPAAPPSSSSVPGSARRSTVGTPSSVVSLKTLDGLLERMEASVGKPVPKPRRPQPPRPERERLGAAAEAEWTPAPELVAAAAARAEMERQPRREPPQKPRSGLEEVFHAMAEETVLGLGAERARDAERIRELEGELENTRELCQKQVWEIMELRERVRAGGLVQRAGGAVQEIMGLRKEVGTLKEALGAEREARAELQGMIAKLKADYDALAASRSSSNKTSKSSSNKTSKSSSSSEDLVNHALTKEVARLSELTAGLRATVAEKDAQVRLLQKQRASAAGTPGKAAAAGQ